MHDWNLVLVTICAGTSKVAEPYKIGTRTTDIKLEILNLNRKEIIPIAEISNQEFSEVNRYYFNCIIPLAISLECVEELSFFYVSLLMVNMYPG